MAIFNQNEVHHGDTEAQRRACHTPVRRNSKDDHVERLNCEGLHDRDGASVPPCLRGEDSFAGRRNALICLGVILALGSSAFAGNWADRAGQMNSTEISAGEAAQKNTNNDQERRNKICVRRIQPAEADVDWNADPSAIPNMLYQVKQRTGFKIFRNNEGLDVSKDEIFEYTVLYLTSHRRWTFNEKETAQLQLFLKRGGTLWLDDCYLRGSPFSDSVRPEVGKMIPGAEQILLTANDPKVKDTFKMIYATDWPGEAKDRENRYWSYFLLDGRPAVFFTPNDDGCDWEVSTPPSASNPIGEGIGHGGNNRQREVSYQWAANFLMFAYTH